MRLQLLSDLHLESEAYTPAPLPDAEALVLAGDIDATWAGLERFAGWPVPVLFVPGNHEFDGRDVDTAYAGLEQRCAELGLHWLERRSLVLTGDDGRRIRFCGSVRWSDFDAFGPQHRERCARAAGYFVRLMGASRGGQVFDAAAIRTEALACRAWLERALSEPAAGRWDASVAVTHFAPSLRSADPRYGQQPSTASFCNDDEDLLGQVDVWLHGHLHCRHDYRSPAGARVVSHARGIQSKGETSGFDALGVIRV